ncbi:hypothetical protein [Rhodococcus erythropolis]|nr:hypothetical protein [Rhodococcus erythropolis]
MSLFTSTHLHPYCARTAVAAPCGVGTAQLVRLALYLAMCTGTNAIP